MRPPESERGPRQALAAMTRIRRSLTKIGATTPSPSNPSSSAHLAHRCHHARPTLVASAVAARGHGHERARSCRSVARPRVRDRDRARQAHGLRAPATGCAPPLKELIDNALDACEEAGVDPEITVTRRRQRAHGHRQRAGHAAGAGRAPVHPLRAHQHPRGLRRARPRRPGQRPPVIMALPFGFGREEAGHHDHQPRRRARHHAAREPAGRGGSISTRGHPRGADQRRARASRLTWPEAIDLDDVGR